VRDYTEAPVADVLIHLAADSDRARAQAAKECYVRDTERVLKGLLAKPYKKIIYSSSAVLYGDQAATPHRPDEPVHSFDAYSWAKYEGEKLVLDSGRGIVVRLTNLYGPGMASVNVLSTILNQVKEDGSNPLKLWDDGPVRDFLWIEDAAEALTLMAKQDVAKPKAAAIYNLASGQGVSVGDLARMALAIAGQPSRPVVPTKPSGKPSVLLLDIADTKADFGWSPRTELKDGLAALVRASL
jgi:UDP-glucose 4-epimerase